MKKITSLLLILAMGMSLIFTGCTEAETTASQESTSEETATIGMCFDTFTIERWLKDRDVFTYTATELGEKVEVLNANGDVQKQRDQIQHFIDIGVKAIVVVAVDGSEIGDLLTKAHNEGIKVIAYDRLIEDAYLDLYISFDNTMVGSEMAQALADCFVNDGNTRKNVIMLEGPESDLNVAMVYDGFMSVAQKANFQIIADTHIDGWRNDNVDAFFEENPDILSETDAIMCGNDSLACEVVNILAQQRLAGSIYVTGQDADLDACQHIAEGTQTVTIYKSVEQMAKLAAEYTIDLMNDKELSAVNQIINNNYMDVPFVGFTPVCVNASNIDEVIIESGFHLREDVYRNVSNDDFLDNNN